MPEISSAVRDVLVEQGINKILPVFIQAAYKYYSLHEFEVTEETIPCMRSVIADYYGVTI